MNTARRQSNALSVGSTPLNKVITIILAAQKTSPAYVAQALDEVMFIDLSFRQTPNMFFQKNKYDFCKNFEEKTFRF